MCKLWRGLCCGDALLYEKCPAVGSKFNEGRLRRYGRL